MGRDVQARRAVLYGIGARLDKQPEFLFRLHESRKRADRPRRRRLPLAKKGPAAAKVLGGEDLSALLDWRWPPARQNPAFYARARQGKAREDQSKEAKRETARSVKMARPSVNDGAAN